MLCLYPVYIGSEENCRIDKFEDLKKFNKPQIVPCGKCQVCVENKRKEWYVRILAESGYSDYNKFVTLTYDDENLPEGGDLRHEDFQLYMKRLRKDFEKLGVKCKYYMCGEYGSKGGRPHYHMIVLMYVKDKLDKKTDLSKIIRENWQLGRVDIGGVTPRSVNYCLGYMKKQTGMHKKRVVKPYQKMSKAIGERYLFENEERLSEKGYIIINGIKYAMPRYYRKKSELIKKKFEYDCDSEEIKKREQEMRLLYLKNRLKKEDKEAKQYEINKLRLAELKRKI